MENAGPETPGSALSWPHISNSAEPPLLTLQMELPTKPRDPFASEGQSRGASTQARAGASSGWESAFEERIQEEISVAHRPTKDGAVFVTSLRPSTGRQDGPHLPSRLHTTEDLS